MLIIWGYVCPMIRNGSLLVPHKLPGTRNFLGCLIRNDHTFSHLIILKWITKRLSTVLN
uniref:Uncharacterized protein n=1 Tax=Arundo donax TaxID=35708 RepID=A0A0A8Y9P3_ARUDO